MIINDSTWNDLGDYRDYLEHYGVKGMRWGVRKQRESSGTSRKRNSKETQDKKTKRAKRRIERAKVRAERREAEAKKKAEKEAAKKEARRKQILSNPTSLYKHRKEFTAQEIQQALQQFDWDKKLRSYSKDTINSGAEFIGTLFKGVNNGINLYNAAVRVVNSTRPGETLPYIEKIPDNKDLKKNQKK